MTQTQGSPQVQEANLDRLRAAIEAAGGNVRIGVRAHTGATITELAERAGLSRQDADMCLGRTYGRTYPGARRALEVELDIPQYSLDTILDGEDQGHD